MKYATINNHAAEIASNWDELDLDTIREIAKGMLYGVTPVELKVKCLLAFTGWRVSTKKVKFDYNNEKFFIKLDKKTEVLMHVDDVNGLASCFNFVFTEVTTKKDQKVWKIDSRLIKNPIKSIIIKRKEYIGPADIITNLKFNEYKTANICLSRWTNSMKEEDLNKFCATLYRPRDKNQNPNSKDYTGDQREKFNDFILDERAKVWRKVPIEDRVCIFLFYTGCLNFLKRKFTRVFPQGIAVNLPDEKFVDPFDSYQTMTESLSHGGEIRIDEINNEYVWQILYRIEKAMKDAEEMEHKLTLAGK